MDYIFSINNVLFTVGGQGVSLLELISVVAGLSCVYLATRTKVANFWIGYLYNILLFFLFYQKGLYSSMLVQPISFAINFFGHYRWTHPKKGEENSRRQLKISLLSNGKRLYFVLQIIVLAAVWGTAISFLDNLWSNIFSEARTPLLRCVYYNYNTYCTISICTEKTGVLGSMVHSQCYEYQLVHSGRTCVYADSQLCISGFGLFWLFYVEKTMEIK